MTNKFTHTGIVRGNDNRTPPSYYRVIELRETKMFWITKYEKKYRKKNGYPLNKWPVDRLDLDSIKEI